METEARILETFIGNHTKQALDSIKNSADQDMVALLENLPNNLSAKLLCQMDRLHGAKYLEMTDLSHAAKLIEEMPIPAALILLRLLHEGRRDAILESTSTEVAGTIRKILVYPKDTVGAYLETRIFTLYQDFTVSEAVESIKSFGKLESSNIFVVDRHQSLVGVVELRILITTEPARTIGSIMDPNPQKVSGNMKATSLMANDNFQRTIDNLPVVDPEGYFLGVLNKESLADLGIKEISTDRRALQASSALGELYQIGLSSLFQGGPEKS